MIQHLLDPLHLAPVDTVVAQPRRRLAGRAVALPGLAGPVGVEVPVGEAADHHQHKEAPDDEGDPQRRHDGMPPHSAL